jgi:hypothetical protein
MKTSLIQLLAYRNMFDDVTGVLAVTNANTLDDTNDSDCRHSQK